jgi:hypothetical protein
MTSKVIRSEVRMDKKFLEKRFGSIAVERGLITIEQLIEALTIQAKENVENGEHRRLGRILLDQVLQVMKRNLPRLGDLSDMT